MRSGQTNANSDQITKVSKTPNRVGMTMAHPIIAGMDISLNTGGVSFDGFSVLFILFLT